MSGNEPVPPTLSRQSLSSSSSPPDHINLRITYLLPGNPRPPHNLGNVSIETPISELKTRIRDELPERPAPEEQRLIYQGRPLLQNDATLRAALRLEGASLGPLPYTIHIIIQPRHQSPNPTIQPSVPLVNIAQQHPSQSPNPSRPDQPILPQQTNHQAMAQAQAVQAMLQTQLSLLQQQLSTLSPSLGQNIGQMPSGMNTTVHINGQPVGQTGQPAGGLPNWPPSLFPQPMNMPHVHHPPHIHPMGQGNAARGQPPNFPGANLGVLPGLPQPPERTNVRETIGPNGERIRTIINGSMNIHISPRGMPNPFERPSSAPGNASNTIPSTEPTPSQGPLATSITESRRLPLPTVPLQPQFSLQNSIAQAFPPGSRSQTFAWLASSPRGPEAVIYAPNHGYFTSTHSNLQSQTPNATTEFPVAGSIDERARSANAQINPATAQSQPTAGVERPPPAHDRGEVQGQQPIAAPNQLQLQPRAQNQNQNQNQDDIFGFIVQRGWLFLRLYMFTFVLSEPGTWRRLFLLTVACIVCLLPRRNPIYDAIDAARRHIDNLIGPPQPRPQQQPQAQRIQGPQQVANGRVNQQGGQQQPAGAGPTATTSTTTAADAQAVAGPPERSPNLLRYTFYRIEQATALFLASLIPGVGERHVRAREESRRELQRLREEQERQRAAEAEAAAAATSTGNEDRGDETGETKHENSAAVSTMNNGSTSIARHSGVSSSVENQSGAASTATEGLSQRQIPGETPALT